MSCLLLLSAVPSENPWRSHRGGQAIDASDSDSLVQQTRTGQCCLTFYFLSSRMCALLHPLLCSSMVSWSFCRGNRPCN
ncbi:unnamed protein product [Musa acuminata subsp. burmannicoides]